MVFALEHRLLTSALSSIKIARRMYETDLLPKGARAFINGKWVKSASGKVFEVRNPYTQDHLYDVTCCDVQDANLAVEAARQAFESWGHQTTAKQRGEILRKWYEIYRDKETELATLLTMEQGKPLSEARIEIQYAAGYFDFYAGEARRITGEIVPSPFPNRSHYHTREPIGVVATFTPVIIDNVSLSICFIVKPAQETPLSALALASTAKEAGFPDGVFNVVPASHETLHDISEFLCSSVNVDCISFTGSTEIGKLLLRQCASTVKRVCLELGGNAPFIVFESADISKAVRGALSSKTRASGQTCVSSNRYFIHSSLHDKFVEELSKTFGSLKCGDGMVDGVQQGPLINEKAIRKVSFLVKDAVDKGAKIIVGGESVPEVNIYKPTILVGVTSQMEIANTEIFGPVVAIQKFDDEDEVLKRANDTRFGLAGYIFSKDMSQITRASRLLQVGMLGVNEGAISCPEAAFGGVKESGLGREGGRQGIDEFIQWKYVSITY